MNRSYFPARFPARLLLAGALFTWSAGCGTAGAGGSAAPESEATHIAVIYRNRCGACHRPVAPGSEPGDKLHAALLEHRKRTRLTEQEWSGIEAFLAPPAAAPGPASP
jgi:mono/diheme cytochrome c family protein